MMTVLQTLLSSRFKDDTIVIFTSDHGDLLGSHYEMHQKWYTAYEEAIRVPLIIWNKKLFPSTRPIENLTSHVDLLPTLLGLAGISQEPIRQTLAQDHSDARPLVGRNLSPLLLGQVNPASVNDPLYFMTDDDPSRGLKQNNWTGIAYNSVVQPNHLETVIARLPNTAGVLKVWKYTRYFDNPQFWSSPGAPSASDTSVEDVILDQKEKTPEPPPYGSPPIGPQPIHFDVTVKSTPQSEEFEMYNVTDDPEQATLAQLLQQQCAQKRLTPCSGDVPGQPLCGQQTCNT
jgi:choline-sulfatase